VNQIDKGGHTEGRAFEAVARMFSGGLMDDFPAFGSRRLWFLCLPCYLSYTFMPHYTFV
jgi:hypothetical protein